MEPTEENAKQCFRGKHEDNIDKGRILKKVEINTLIRELQSIAKE